MLSVGESAVLDLNQDTYAVVQTRHHAAWLHWRALLASVPTHSFSNPMREGRCSNCMRLHAFRHAQRTLHVNRGAHVTLTCRRTEGHRRAVCLFAEGEQDIGENGILSLVKPDNFLNWNISEMCLHLTVHKAPESVSYGLS
jgi:hypothetical protein